MASKFVSKRNLHFLLYEVFDIVSLTRYPYYQQHNQKAFKLILDAALKMAKDLLHPTFEEMDRKQPEMQNGVVHVHPSVRSVMEQFGEGGWIASTFAEKFDGEQLPYMISDCCKFVFAAANYSAAVYPGLTSKAAHLITSFGDQAQIDAYVPQHAQRQVAGHHGPHRTPCRQFSGRYDHHGLSHRRGPLSHSRAENFHFGRRS